MAFFETSSWSSSWSSSPSSDQYRFPSLAPLALNRSNSPSRPESDPENEIDTNTKSGCERHQISSISPTNTISFPAAQPVLVPTTPINRRDPERVPTPLTGRGDRQGHFFPIKDTSPTRLLHSSTGSEIVPQTVSAARIDHTYHQRSLSLTLPPRSRPLAMMHSDRTSCRYTPTSPLSPRLDAASRPISPQPSRARGQASRPMNVALPNYHPMHFQQQRDMPPTTSSPHFPVLNYTTHSSGTESTKLMKERQRELIDKAKLSSRIAASPSGVKPDAPRLDPLRSPKGPMTPLALEEGDDYFLMTDGASCSPSASPSARREGSASKPTENTARAKRTSGGSGSGGRR